MSLPLVKDPAADRENCLDDDKDAVKQGEVELGHDSDISFGVLDSEQDIATHIISVHDDPNLNPWTLRAFVVGLGLSAFGGVLGKAFAYFSSFYHLALKFWTAEIYYFKPV